jgi:hypothetical protein
VPDLATSWSWSEDGTELTFPLRQGRSTAVIGGGLPCRQLALTGAAVPP